MYSLFRHMGPSGAYSHAAALDVLTKDVGIEIGSSARIVFG